MFSFGIHLESLFLQSANDKWQPSVVAKDVTVIRKVFALETCSCSFFHLHFKDCYDDQSIYLFRHR